VFIKRYAIVVVSKLNFYLPSSKTCIELEQCFFGKGFIVIKNHTPKQRNMCTSLTSAEPSNMRYAC